jgi:hypothetical protein
MALWGNNDNVGSGGLVSLDYGTRVVTGAGTTFGQVGAAKTGDVIRFGVRGGLGVYFGDAVVASIAGTESLTIASTTGLSGAAIASTDFLVSELPSYTVGDSHYSELNTGYDAIVYGISTTTAQTTGGPEGYQKIDAGWVGVTTYMAQGVLRVKRETLVAASGITTGGIAYPTDV